MSDFLSNDIKNAYVIDDTYFDRIEMKRCLEFRSWNIGVFDTGDKFLKALDVLDTGCVFVDMQMPGMNGLDVVHAIRSQGNCWPIIAVSFHADISIVVRAMRIGANDFIEKPCTPKLAQEAFERSFSMQVESLASWKKRQFIVQTVTARELEVVKLVASGHATKSIAFELGISQRTVEVHRTNIMKRLQVKNVAELIRLAVDAGIGGAKTQVAHPS